MKKFIALILVIIICSLSMVSCQLSIFSLIHQLTDETPGYFTYTDFTDEEKALFETYIGETIPFMANDRYEITSFYGDGNYDEGIRFLTYHNTKEDFALYLDRFSDYTLSYTDKDSDGDTWYHLTKGNIVVAMSYYRALNLDIIDVFIYIDDEAGEVVRGTLTNDGAGLPTGQNGVYKVDFTAAEHVKDAKDLNSYLSGCPSTGSPAVLVIPVQFIDSTAEIRGYSIDNIKKAFNGKTGSTNYYSVDEYYYLSSYGTLDLDITVLDSWFTPKHMSSYYKDKTVTMGDQEVPIGDQMILNEALDYLDDKMDLSKFDSDGNGYIDAVVMINTLTVNSDSNFSWAFRYWNIYSDGDDNLYQYDGVSANDYAWMSYGFIHESADKFGRPTYNNNSVINPKTYIHEMAHILGAEDYYDTSYEDEFGPLWGKDIMDASIGDHNPFTKISLGWITSSRLVTTDSSTTLYLEDFKKSGDTIILATNFDPTLGAYQEYYILMYYTKGGLNTSQKSYFAQNGLVIYHVNASLYYETRGDETVYFLDNDNDSGGSHKSFLLELVKINVAFLEIPYFVFTEGMTLTYLSDDNGNYLPYTITVDQILSDGARITFTHN